MATHCSILGLENPMDGGSWLATVHRVARSQTGLNDFTHPLTHSLKFSLLVFFEDFYVNRHRNIGLQLL